MHNLGFIVGVLLVGLAIYMQRLALRTVHVYFEASRNLVKSNKSSPEIQRIYLKNATTLLQLTISSYSSLIGLITLAWMAWHSNT